MRLLLLGLGLLYLFIGVVITAFCVHMCYHESAAGFGDHDDRQAQRVLESKFGLLLFVLLFAFWPIALLIAFKGAWDREDAAKQAAKVSPPVASDPAPAPATTASAAQPTQAEARSSS